MEKLEQMLVGCKTVHCLGEYKKNTTTVENNVSTSKKIKWNYHIIHQFHTKELKAGTHTLERQYS